MSVEQPVHPYRGVRVQLDSDDEDNHHTQEDEYQSFVTNNANSSGSNNNSSGRFQSIRNFFSSWNNNTTATTITPPTTAFSAATTTINNNNTTNINNNNNVESSINDDDDNDHQHHERRSPFSLFSNLSPSVRRRVVALLTISMLFIVIIALHFIIVASFNSSSDSSSSDGKDNSDNNSGSNFRTVLLYTLTIPNAILFSCIALCCTCMWGKKLLTLCLNRNRSTLIRNLKYYLLKYGLVRYEGEQDDWDGDEISERNQRLLELLQSRGMDVNSLRLMMIDRDFNSNDYDTLLQLDGRHNEPRGVSENTLSRLTLYRIPPLSSVEHSEDADADLYNSGSNVNNNNGSTSANEQDASVPYCSENLGRTLLEESCCICLSKYECGEVVCTLPTCLHRYHRDCVFQALRMRNQCPICKTAI